MNEQHWLLQLLTPGNIIPALLTIAFAAWALFLKMAAASVTQQISGLTQQLAAITQHMSSQSASVDERFAEIQRRLNDLTLCQERRITRLEAIIERRIPPSPIDLP